jgi:hypothetical protein
VSAGSKSNENVALINIFRFVRCYHFAVVCERTPTTRTWTGINIIETSL